jgi:hypothetical protein
MFEDKVCTSQLCLQVESPPEGTDKNLFVLNGTERLQETFRGLNVSYPDFFNKEWKEKFSCNISNLANNAEDILGGFVLQDNWPASTTPHNKAEDMTVAEVCYIYL